MAAPATQSLKVLPAPLLSSRIYQRWRWIAFRPYLDRKNNIR